MRPSRTVRALRCVPQADTSTNSTTRTGKVLVFMENQVVTKVVQKMNCNAIRISSGSRNAFDPASVRRPQYGQA